MDVKQIVDDLYPDRKLDRFKPVSRYTYRQQTLRTKVEIANIYLDMYRIKRALDDAQISIMPLTNKQQEIRRLVTEDEAAFDLDMEKNSYDRREDAYDEGSLIELLRRIIAGDPQDPYAFEKSTEGYPEAKKVTPPAGKRPLSKAEKQQKFAKEAEKEKAHLEQLRSQKKEAERQKKKRFAFFKRKEKPKKDVKHQAKAELKQEVLYEKQKEEEIERLLKSVDRKGGIKKASEKEMQDLGALIEEVEAYLT